MYLIYRIDKMMVVYKCFEVLARGNRNRILKLIIYNLSENRVNNQQEKSELHARNKHRSRYNFKQLIGSCKELKRYVALNEYGDESIDFGDPNAVKTLNKALLKHFYGIPNWDIPENYLCPPIPGRADYIHYVADLLASCNKGVIPQGKSIRVLDIGVGANCIYPLIGNREYGWSFVGTDIDPVAIDSARSIIDANPILNGAIECRQQGSPMGIFRGIGKADEQFDISICNPPFHASLKEAEMGTRRKWKNLDGQKVAKHVLNFGGQKSELWCKGGERAFIQQMIEQSVQTPRKCLWFSTLVSKKENLNGIYKSLQNARAFEVRTVNMTQGQKTSRFVAWTFLSDSEQAAWKDKRWK